ncbi:MAG TPA: peroxiredoxin [Fusobacteriaceae bacterium]|nr:peroxiredoxin [Fusobacteriaceae bacterium]
MENSMPLLGDRFPELEVHTTHGPLHLPNDLKGSWFVLFSHPADFTPVCTTEFVAFQNIQEELEKINCALVGMSIDQVFSHIKWVQWIKENLDVEIKFPIIAANDSVANKLGMLHPGKGSSSVRAVFIVDPEGNVRLIMYYPQEIGRNMEEVLRSVKALQLSDANGVAIPANWPNNVLFGSDVIVEPAKTEAEAKKRLEDKTITCLDWWMCHKKL